MIRVLVTYTEGGIKGTLVEQAMVVNYTTKLTPAWCKMISWHLFGPNPTLPDGLTMWDAPPLTVPGTYSGYRVYQNACRKVKREIKETIEW